MLRRPSWTRSLPPGRAAFCFLLSAFSLLSAAKCRAWDDSSAHAMREVRPKITMVREVYESDYKYDSAEQYGAG